jgi:hypothetical protein
MSSEYIVGATEVAEAFSTNPAPDYIIYNSWDKVTEDARDEAKRRRIWIVSFTKFQEMLRNGDVRPRHK